MPIFEYLSHFVFVVVKGNVSRKVLLTICKEVIFFDKSSYNIFKVSIFDRLSIFGVVTLLNCDN